MPTAAKDTVTDAWHLDKRVPIALIGAIVVGALGNAMWASWWVAKLDGRVERIEQRALALETAQDADRLWQGSVRGDLGEIKAKLGILIDRMQAEGRRQ